MINFEFFGGEDKPDPFSFLETNGLEAQKFADDQLAAKDQLARMVRAVGGTEAGAYVLNWLAQTYVVRAHFSPDLKGGMEAVAMKGLWHTAQAEVVLTLLALARHTPAPAKPENDHGPEQPDAAGKPRRARQPRAAGGTDATGQPDAAGKPRRARQSRAAGGTDAAS